ncbi:molybdenum cofactor biosynthesis protein MoaE [bacterium]|nr:molybdenum cofactor biosynthesis protein MoaE [bacterium]
MIHTEICRQTISIDKSIAFVTHRSCGALCTFIGTVRDNNDGKKVTALEYECYLPMAENVLNAIAQDAERQFDIENIFIVHRYGHLAVSDISVLICVSSAHRNDSFEACRFIIETIKKDVPLWKKEYYEDSPAQWVTCRHDLKKEQCLHIH